jgi:hypothetical protein
VRAVWGIRIQYAMLGICAIVRCPASREREVMNVVMSCIDLGDRKPCSVLKTMSDRAWRARNGRCLSLTSLH